MRWTIILLVFSVCIGKSFAQLRCYACSFTSVDTASDQAVCLVITNSTRSVDCSYQYCTIFRQEFIDPPGVIASFLRGCVDSPDFLNHEIVDSTFRTFYRACTNDLCNRGDGIESVVGGSLIPNPLYQGDNLLVPGTGSNSSASNIEISFLVLLFTVLTNCIT